jgi:hypothetical protein
MSTEDTVELSGGQLLHHEVDGVSIEIGVHDASTRRRGVGFGAAGSAIVVLGALVAIARPKPKSAKMSTEPTPIAQAVTA